MNLTPSAKPGQFLAQWFVVDATDLPLGRLSSEVAKRLMGKHKGVYTSHTDTGDHVVIVNAEKVKLTGKKAQQEEHFWHTGYAGGIKSITPAKTLESAHPQRLIERGVQRMLPKNTMGRQMFSKLHVYAGGNHPHAAQQPKTLDMKTLIAKKAK